jgi:hypothetical protein
MAHLKLEGMVNVTRGAARPRPPARAGPPLRAPAGTSYIHTCI